jgi:hypothetical protein
MVFIVFTTIFYLIEYFSLSAIKLLFVNIKKWFIWNRYWNPFHELTYTISANDSHLNVFVSQWNRCRKQLILTLVLQTLLTFFSPLPLPHLLPHFYWLFFELIESRRKFRSNQRLTYVGKQIKTTNAFTSCSQVKKLREKEGGSQPWVSFLY